MAADEFAQDFFEVGGRVYAVQFAALDERGERGPVFGAFVGSSEERILGVMQISP